MRVSHVVVGALALLLMIASDLSAQGLDRGPAYLFVKGLGSTQPMVEGNEYQLEFSGGADGGQIELFTELPIEVPEACTKQDFAVICPSGSYTATIRAEFAIDDTFTGFTLTEISPVEGYRIASAEIPLVSSSAVTPFRVKVLGINTSGALVEISVINTTDTIYQGEVVVGVYRLGGETEDISMGVLVKPGEIEKYQTHVDMVARGTHILSFNVEGNIYYPTGGDIFFPYTPSDVYMPQISN